MLILWIILPVRNTAVRLCPKIQYFLPEYELVSFSKFMVNLINCI